MNQGMLTYMGFKSELALERESNPKQSDKGTQDRRMIASGQIVQSWLL